MRKIRFGEFVICPRSHSPMVMDLKLHLPYSRVYICLTPEFSFCRRTKKRERDKRNYFLKSERNRA